MRTYVCTHPTPAWYSCSRSRTGIVEFTNDTYCDGSNEFQVFVSEDRRYDQQLTMNYLKVLQSILLIQSSAGRVTQPSFSLLILFLPARKI